MTLEAFRQTRSRQKRAAIFAAARAMFRRDGFARAAMEEIAREAGVSTATLYRHFPSKAALFEAVAAQSIETLALGEAGGAPLPRLEALASRYAALLCAPDTRGLVRMLIAETGAGGDLSERFYAAVKSQVGEAFAGAVIAAMEAGVVTPHDDPAHLAGQLQGMIEHGTLLRGLILGDEVETLKPPAAIAAEALRTWLARWGAEAAPAR